MLADADITEDDIGSFGEFPAFMKKKLVAATKKAVEEGVHVEGGAGAGGEGEEEGELETRKAMTLKATKAEAKKQVSNATSAAAGVFSGVSFMFLFISFLVALDSVANGILVAAWMPLKKGISLEINGKVVLES